MPLLFPMGWHELKGNRCDATWSIAAPGQAGITPKPQQPLPQSRILDFGFWILDYCQMGIRRHHSKIFYAFEFPQPKMENLSLRHAPGPALSDAEGSAI